MYCRGAGEPEAEYGTAGIVSGFYCIYDADRRKSRDCWSAIMLDLFWSYRLFFISPVMRLQILNNIWLFVPLGAMLYRLWPRGYVVLIPVLLSLGIETLQLVLGRGLFETDDIISNSLGGLIGVLVCWGIRKGIAALST